MNFAIPVPVMSKVEVMVLSERSILVMMVEAVRELVNIAKVDNVLGIDVRDPVPGRAPLMLDTHKACPLMKGATMVLACNELVKTAKVERLEGIFARPPAPTTPYAVDKEDIAELIDESILNVLTYPDVPRPVTVDVNEVVK